MRTNTLVIDFLKNNFLLMGLFIICIWRIIPQEWAGFWKYNNNRESEGRAPKISILRLVLHNTFEGATSSFLIPLLAAFSFKNTVTIIVFVVVSFDIFFLHQISGHIITLISIGIIALYLERLIETGKNIKLFGGLISWEKNDR